MNGTVNYLKLLITGDDSQLDATLKKSKRTVTGYVDDMAGSMGVLGKAIASMLAGLSVAAAVGKLVSVQREFDVLNSSLKTVTGSSAAAEREMAWLKDFAKSTPFGLAQATDGFVKMKALGLDPTRAALNSFGNTASAMGKDLNQMIEAVADASTGEFERLKEFGIKASKEGNKVSFTFQGVTTTVRNSSAEITKYLENIGNTTFGGAMEERAKTLDGIIAGLGDTWDELFRTINSQQTGSLIFDSVMLASSAIENATTILKAYGGVADTSAQQTGAFAGVQEGLAVTFETVAVLAAQLTYVLKGVGREIGGWAAQLSALDIGLPELANPTLAVAKAAMALAKGQGSVVAQIHRDMQADAEAARKEVDATTERILGARGAMAEYNRWATRNASAATDPRRVDLGGKPSKPTVDKPTDTKGLKAAENSYKSLQKSVDDYVASMELEAQQGSKLTTAQKLQIQLDGLLSNSKVKVSAATVQGVRDSLAKAKKLEDEAEAAKRAVAAYQEYLVLQDELNADYVAQSQAREQGRKSVDEYNTGIRESGELLQLELSMMGESEQARGIAIEQYRIELELKKQIAAVKANTGFNQAQRDEMIASLHAGAAIATAQASSKVFLDEWQSSVKKYNDIFSQGFADMLNNGKDGWKSFTKSLVTTFKTSVADQIYKMFLQPFVVNVVGNLMGVNSGLGTGSYSKSTSTSGSMAGGGLTDWSTWGSKASGWASDASFKLVTNGWEDMGSSMMDLSRTITSVDGYLKDIPGMSGGIGSAAGYLGALYSLSQGKVGSAAGAAIGTYIFPGIGTMIGSALGGLLDGLDDSGTKHMGAGAIYSKVTGVQDGAGIYNQGSFGMGHRDEYSAAIQEGVSGIAKGLGETLDAFAVSFGKTAGYSVATAFADDSSKDGAWGSLKIADELGQVLINWDDTRASSWAPRVFADGEAGNKEYLNAIAVDMKNVFLEMDLPGWADQILQTAKDIDTLNAALQQIATVKTVFEGLGKTMAMFAGITDDAQNRLLTASGGVDALAGNAEAFYQGFFTEGERALKQRELQMAALARMGLYIDPAEGDAAKELFRKTVQEAMGSGQIELAAQLLAMSGAFASTADYAQQMLDAVEEVPDAWADLGSAMGIFSGATSVMQARLLAAAGSMDALASGAEAFYQGFYSDHERALGQRDVLMQSLGDLGLYIDPAEGEEAKELFRITVEEAMSSGQAELAVKLLAMAGEFASAADYAKQFFDDLAQSAVQSMSGAWSNFGTMAGLAAQYTGNTSGLSQQLGVVQGSYANATTTDGRVAALQQIINLEQGLWNGQQAARQAEAAAATARANAAREQVNAAKQLLSAAQSLGDYAKSLGFSEASGLGDRERLAALDSERRELLAKARAGDAGAMQELQSVTGNYLTLAEQMAVSQQDYSVLSGRIAAELAATAAIQEASATSQVSQYERQIAAAEAVASSSAGQFTVSAATQKLIDELLVESATAFETESTLTQTLIDQGGLTVEVLKGLPAELSGAIGASLIPAISGLVSTVSSAVGLSVPQFAAGGDHMGGLRIVGERGWELEATGPSRIWNQSQLAGALGGGSNNDALLAEIRALRADNRVYAGQVVRLQAEVARIARRWDGGGMPPARKEAAV